MLDAAIDKILGLAKIDSFEFGERQYSARPIYPVEPPLDCTENVTTLSGLAELCKSKVNELDPSSCFLQVLSPKKVVLAELGCNEWGKRQHHITACLPEYSKFRFNEYLSQEDFIIGLSTYFVREAGDLMSLLQVAGNLTAEQVQTSTDDGVSQKVAMRTGAVLASTVEVKRIVKLKPWRTFREIEQPTSEFLFRLKNRSDEVPSLALFLADGEMWQHEAMQKIQTWLELQSLGIPVIA